MVLLAAAIGTWSAVQCIELSQWIYRNPENQDLLDTYTKLGLEGVLGLSLFLGIALWSERRKWSKGRAVLANIIVLGLLVIHYLTFDPEITSSLYQFGLYVLAGHLFVAFIPFIGTKATNGFWQYNKTLFLRFLTSLLYSGVLFAGLSMAILAIDKLFGVKFDDRIYGQLFIIIGGIFNTWFFLSGVPEDFNTLEATQDYPKGLKIFTQFILLPLITIYLAILYAYCLKILFDQHWPNGWVSNPVLWFSTIGILSYLLLYPIRNAEGNTWITTYGKWFFISLYPLIVLLSLGIYERVSEYGITEERYFIITLTLWLFLITLYFTFSKSKNIKVIPISLFAIALFISIGPWSAFSVSKRSQFHRLERMIELANHDTATYDQYDRKSPYNQVRSITRYLLEDFGEAPMREWLTEKVPKASVLVDSTFSFSLNNVIKALPLDSTVIKANNELQGATYAFSRPTREHQIIPVDRNSIFIGVDNLRQNTDTVLINNEQVFFFIDSSSKFNIVFSNTRDSLNLDLRAVLTELRRKDTGKSEYSQSIGPEDGIYTLEGKHYSIKVYLNYLYGTPTDVMNLTTYLFIHPKENL